jgi:hypothetical protein
MDDRAKVTAAVSAVLHYIRSEEQNIAMQFSQPGVEQMTAVAGPAPAKASNSWGMSGRQVQMQMGNLMQMRAFRKLR